MTNKKYLYLDLLREYHLKLKPVIESKANSSDVYNKTDVYNKSEVDAALDSKSDVGHTHDQYLTEQNVYTKEQVDLALESKSDISHTHDQYLTDIGIDISFDGSDTLKGTATDYKILGVDSTKTYYLSGTKFIGTGCTNITIAPIIGTSATCTYDEETGIVSWTIYGTSSSGPVSANLSWTGAPGILTSTKDGIKTTVGYFNTINGESVVSKTESKNFDIYTKSQVDNKLNAKADASNVYSKSEVNTKLNAKANVSDVYTTSDVDVKINGINLKLNAKANASDVYTSTQVDNKLNEKANVSDVYTSTTIDAKLNLKANSSDVYTKSQVDTKLNEKANASDVYTTTQVDNKLNEKANASDVYTSTTIDAKLNLKANSSDVYTRDQMDTALNLKANASDVYTSTQVDNKLNEKANVSDVYTSTTIDAKLNLKANSSDVYTKSQVDTKLNAKANASNVYTKTETNNLINSIAKTVVFDTYNKFIEFLEDTSQATYDYFNVGDSIYIKEEGSDYWISGKEDIVEDADVYRYISGNTGSELLGTDNIFRKTVTKNIGTTYTSVTVDGIEPLGGSCGYSNFSWNSSTGDVTITLESLQPNKDVTARLKCHVSASGGGDYGYYYISNIGPDISGKANLAGNNTFTGGQTITGNDGGYSVNASGYVKGSWLQAPSSGKASTNTGKVCVLDNAGWIYYRTPAEIVSDGDGATKATTLSGYGITNAYTKTETDNKLNEKANASDVYTSTTIDAKLNLKANSSDVYTRDQMDTALNLKANASDVYTSTQVDNKLNEKANVSDVYTSTTIDAKLNLKANSSDVYTRDQMDTALNLKANASDVYTTTQVDNKLSGKSPVGHTHDSILDYGDTSKTIKIGYSGAGLTASQIGYIAGYTNGANANEHKIKDISKDVLKSWLGYTEVSSGIISYGGTLTATSGYVWIVYPYDYSANTFTFTYGSGERTGYGFAIVQGEGCIRYFSSTTQLTRYSISRVTFSKQMVYIKFKIG